MSQPSAPTADPTSTSNAAAAQPPGRPGARVFAGRFLLTMLAVASIVTTAGWVTGARQVMHGALLAVAVAAFLPLVIVAVGLVLAAVAVLFVMLLALVTGGDGAGAAEAAGIAEPFVEGGVRMAPGYYGFLARRWHPVFWGVPAGLLVGGLVLWGVLAAAVLPGEARTAEILADAQARVEAAYQRRSRYPAPDAAGHLPLAAIHAGDPAAAPPGVLLDGFGRPVEYAKSGHWKFAGYRLRSHGFDGKPGGGDDLCRHGTTRAGRYVQLLRAGRGLGGKGVSIDVRLGAIRETRCDD